MTIPASWAIARIADVVEASVEQGPPTKKVVYIDIGSVDRDSKSIESPQEVTGASAPTRARQWVRTGDVLVSMTRPNLNAVAKVPATLEGAVASTGFDILRAVEVLSDWLFFRVRTQEFIKDVCEGVQGVVYPAVRPADIRRHELPIPPTGEQKRIVEALESYLSRLGSAASALGQAQDKLKAYRASVLKAAVEGRLVPTEAELALSENRNYESGETLLKRILAERRRKWEETELPKLISRGKHSKDESSKSKWRAPQRPKLDQLPKLPTGWAWATVEEIAADTGKSIGAGPFGTIFKAKDFRDEGIPIVFLRHVKPDQFLTRKPTYMDRQTWEKLFQEYSVYGGELLVTKLGDPPGDCAIFPQSGAPAMLTPDVMKLEVDAALVHPRYVMHYINSNVARRYVFGTAFGTTRSRLTIPLFRAMPIPVPPIAEQGRIVEEIDRLLTVEYDVLEDLDVSKRRTARLRQAVLKWAFEGRLVDQDPNDEPASKLLERVRAARSDEVPVTKTIRRRKANAAK